MSGFGIIKGGAESFKLENLEMPTSRAMLLVGIITGNLVAQANTLLSFPERPIFMITANTFYTPG